MITSRSVIVDDKETKKENLKNALNEKVVPKKKEVPKLFEEFFIVGVEQKVLEVTSESMQRDTTYVIPEILFQYPNLPEHKNWFVCLVNISERRKAVKDFCFPEGGKLTELKKTDSMSEALRQIIS